MGASRDGSSRDVSAVFASVPCAHDTAMSGLAPKFICAGSKPEKYRDGSGSKSRAMDAGPELHKSPARAGCKYPLWGPLRPLLRPLQPAENNCHMKLGISRSADVQTGSGKSQSHVSALKASLTRVVFVFGCLGQYYLYISICGHKKRRLQKKAAGSETQRDSDKQKSPVSGPIFITRPRTFLLVQPLFRVSFVLH